MRRWTLVGSIAPWSQRLCCSYSIRHSYGTCRCPLTGRREVCGPVPTICSSLGNGYRQWIMVIPRSAECFEGLSINALGFAGGLSAKNAAQVGLLRSRGPMTAWRPVGYSRQTSVG
ncbi:MAG: hypothetical protein AB7G48_18490 [Nitrospiraceae bacterium]